MMIEQFLDYLRYERGFSALTVQNYGKDLRAFKSYVENLDNHLSLESADSDVIRDWMESMMDRGNTATSICRRFTLPKCSLKPARPALCTALWPRAR